MSENSKSNDLDKLGDRLKEARKQQADGNFEGKPRGKAMGMAYRMSMEMVIAVLVGAYLGWLLDDWFATKPLFLIIMFFLGVVAGITNVVRTSNRMSEEEKERNDDKNIDEG